MNRKIRLLLMLCSLVSTLVAQDAQSREITIHPFAAALVAQSEDSDRSGTVKFQKESYWIMPRYTMFIDGAPALQVFLGLKGVVLDVYHYADGKKNRILSTNWKGKGRDYEGVVVSEEALAELGISQEELLNAVALLPSIHYPLSKSTWTTVSQDAAQKGEVSLWIHPPQPEAIVVDAQPVTDEELPAEYESSIPWTIEEEPSVIVENEPQPNAEEELPVVVVVSEELEPAAEEELPVVVVVSEESEPVAEEEPPLEIPETEPVAEEEPPVEIPETEPVAEEEPPVIVVSDEPEAQPIAEEEPAVIVEDESTPEVPAPLEEEAQHAELQQQVLELAAQAEEAYAELIQEASAPPTLEEEQQAVAEFIQTLPEELQEEAISLEIECLDF